MSPVANQYEEANPNTVGSAATRPILNALREKLLITF